MKMAVISGDWQLEPKCVQTVRGGHRIIAAARQSGADISMDDGTTQLFTSKARRSRRAAFWSASRTLYMIPFILVRAIAGLQVILVIAYGLFMLSIPELWYGSLPAISETAMYNHLIRSIGMIQLLAGLAFGIGMLRPERRAALWSTTSLWLVAHAGLHLSEVVIGISAPSAIVQDIPAVYLPAIFGAILTSWAVTNASSQRKRALAAWRGRTSPVLQR